MPTHMLISPIRIALLGATALSSGCKPTAHEATIGPGTATTNGAHAPGATRALEDVPRASIAFTGDEATVAAKRAFVEETCAMMYDADDPEGRRCEIVQDLGDWLVIRSSDAIHQGMRWRWFIGALTDEGRVVLLVSADAEFPREDHVPPDAYYELCRDTTKDSTPPRDSGLVALEIVEITGDGRPDLQLECKDTDIRGDHYLRVCPGGDEGCTEPQLLPD